MNNTWKEFVGEYKTELQMTRNIEKLLCECISERRLIRIYYESVTGGKKWRILEPYIVGIKFNGEGNAFLAALPVTELSNTVENRRIGHYLLNKIDVEKIEVLKDTYDEPRVERHRITHTPTIKVICRYMYKDELVTAMPEHLVERTKHDNTRPPSNR